MCLFQHELSLAAQTPDAAQTPTDAVDARVPRQAAAAPAADMDRAAASPLTHSRPLLVGAAVGLVVAVAAFCLLHASYAMESSVEDKTCEADLAARGSVPGCAVGGGSASMFNTPSRPLNGTAEVFSMREQGLRALRISDCWKAEYYFSLALRHLEDEANATTKRSGASADAVLDAFFHRSRSILLGDQGFALVCAQRFVEGVKLLEQHVASEGFKSSPSHILNALGYARFRMKEYLKADEVFERATKVDPSNPILWNNLAAARMVQNKIQAADDAMYHTFDHVENKHSFHLEEYHLRLFQSNVQNLVDRSGGQKARLPTVELWLPG